MFFSPRIATRPLVGLCRRLGTSLEAGIDVRTAWAREADRAGGPLRRNLLMVSRAINDGDSLASAVQMTGNYFPGLFREMLIVGEQTGHLDAVMIRLADHYQHQLDMRRGFVAAILWPMAQLVIAILVVGGLIWVTDLVRGLTGNKSLDLVGIGLVGTRGLIIYAIGLVGVLIAFRVVLKAMSRGLMWTRPIQRIVLNIPGIGGVLQTVSMARLAWSLNVTLDTGMDLRQAIQLSLRSTQNAIFMDRILQIDAEIENGNSIYKTFCRAGVFPVEFLDTVAVGEDSGRLVESMAIAAKQYQDRAKSSLSILTTLAGWVVWAAVGALLLAVVFRLFSFYVGILDQATRG
jgi:type IV pilus assembly protein PilC